MTKEIPEYLEAEWQTAKDEYKVKTTTYITITKFEYEKLQQENQQLKEELNKYKRIYRENPTLYDEIAPYIINECNLENIIKQYKSVLDEIREYINEHSIYFATKEKVGNYFANCSCDDLLQILDKVGKEQ